VLAGASLNQRSPWRAEQIGMHYWFVQHPTEAEVIQYSATRFQSDRSYLEELVAAIEHDVENENFSLTEDEKRCKFCQYRSFCERGIAAGDIAEMDEAEDAGLIDEGILNIDLEQIGEIAF
jgi:hypothetical protein